MLINYNGYEFQVDFKNPSRRFKGAKAKAPPIPDPTPTVRMVDEEIKQRDQDRRRQRISAAGRAGTILTQGAPLAGNQSASLLGKSTS